MASVTGAVHLFSADFSNDIGAIDPGGAQLNAFRGQAGQQRAAAFIDMRNVAQIEMNWSPPLHRLWLQVSTASTHSSTSWPSTVILMAFGSSAVKIRIMRITS